MERYVKESGGLYGALNKRLANRLNHTPRKCLALKAPAELFVPQLKPLRFECKSIFRLSLE
jgi:hypothetical protein